MRLAFTVLRFGVEDKAGDIIDADGCEVPEYVSTSREFMHGFQNRLGPARLTKHEDRVVAEWNWPGGDMLPPIALYPAIGGDAFARQGKHITKCKITQIGISATPNMDAGILSIQEQNPSAPINWGKEDPKAGLIKKAPPTDKVGEHVEILGASVKSHSHEVPPIPKSSD